MERGKLKSVDAAATPSSAEELAVLLGNAAVQSRSISVVGNRSKKWMAGPLLPADVALSTVRLNRILHYEPNDLTVSVEAGTRWSELQFVLVFFCLCFVLVSLFVAVAS